MISYASSNDGLTWQYKNTIIDEPFHLSYPFVFGHDGEIYMTPECNETSSVRLYKATRFPGDWEHVETLLSGRRFSDPTLFYYSDRWWMFTETDPNGTYSRLCLYHSDNLFSGWCEHPMSPVVENDRTKARPAGKIRFDDSAIYRFAQDCYPRYGTRIRAFQITSLTPTYYQEKEIEISSLLSPNGEGWNAKGMHHIDLHKNPDGLLRAYVDGWNDIMVTSSYR